MTMTSEKGRRNSRNSPWRKYPTLKTDRALELLKIREQEKKTRQSQAGS